MALARWVGRAIGLDVHRDFCVVAICEDGQVRSTGRVPKRESVDAGVRHIAFLDSEIAAVERVIAQQALSWPEIRRLMTVPGVNLICAATFIAAVGNPNRFLTSRKLVAYLGLDPEGPSVRRGTSTQRPDLQARIGVGAVGASRSRLERRAATRAAARLL